MAVSRYRFRSFRLDPAARELWKDDQLIVLPGSALDCLVYLVEHRDRAVERDELISAVWGRNVADALLAQTILRLRRTLGDSHSEGAIRTIARFGYRWVEEIQVENAEDALPDVVAQPVEADATGMLAEPAGVAADVPRAAVVQRGLPKSVWGGGILLLVLITALGYFALRAPDDERPEASVVPTSAIASAFVLPAEVPEASDWGWLRLGLMDLIGNRLRQGGVPTAPSESVLVLLGERSDKSLPAFTKSSGLRVQPSAVFSEGQWTIALQVERGHDSTRIEASSEDVLVAARRAADLLLIRLGHVPADESGFPHSLALEELLQRTRSATLADQLDLARRLIEQAPAEIQAHPEVELRKILIDQARGLYGEAEAHLLALLDRVPVDLDPALRARILNTLGTIQFRLGHSVEAGNSYAEAIRLLGNVREPMALANAYSGRASVAVREGALDSAAADLGRARVEMEVGGDALGVATVDMNLGIVQNHGYRPSQALPVLLDAEARFVSLGAREPLAYVRYILVNTYLQLLDMENARATAARFWPPEAHTGNQRLRWQLVFAKALVLFSAGSLSDADALLDRLDREADVVEDAFIRARGKALASLVMAARGWHEEAVVMARAVLTEEFGRRQPEMYVSTSVTCLRSLRRLGRVDEAAAGTVALRSWVAAQPNAWRETYAVLAEAEQAAAQGQVKLSSQRFADAYARAEALGVPEDLVEVSEPYVLNLLEDGHVDRASAVVGRIAAWADRDVRVASAQAQLYRAQSRTTAWQRSSERMRQLAGERVLAASRID